MANQMTKTQLVAALAEEMGADKKTAGAALDAIAAVVAKTVAEGGAVTLPGLGKIACKRLARGVDSDAYSAAYFIERNLSRDTTSAQAFQFLGAAINIYCPDQVGVLQAAAQ